VRLLWRADLLGVGVGCSVRDGYCPVPSEDLAALSGPARHHGIKGKVVVWTAAEVVFMRTVSAQSAADALCLSRWSELLNEERPFTEEEKAFFDRQAHHAYADFRNKVRLAPSPTWSVPAPTAAGLHRHRSTARACCQSVAVSDYLSYPGDLV